MIPMSVGIIGCGRMGKERARASSAWGAKVGCVYDRDPAQSKAIADQYPGCVIAEDAFEVVRRGPAALFICSPPSARGVTELAAIESRTPFFVEKPIGVSAEQAAPIIEKLAGTNLVHAVGYQNRCRGSIAHARRILAGRTILAISAFWVGRKY